MIWSTASVASTYLALPNYANNLLRSGFSDDDVAQVIINAQKRTKGTGLGGTEETPDDRTDWDTYLEWFTSLGCPQATLDDVADHVIHAAEVAGTSCRLARSRV